MIDDKNEKMPKPFADLCGVLIAERSVSLENMDEAIEKYAIERFNRCNLDSDIKQAEAFIQEDVKWGLHGDD